MADAFVERVPVEGGLTLRAIVRPDDFDAGRRPLHDVVDELDSGLLAGAAAQPLDAFLLGVSQDRQTPLGLAVLLLLLRRGHGRSPSRSETRV
ncbi:hypothetical protein ACFW6F_10635 [Streptomyces sp. NPDC058746]|uniref:hypothetical protein n=1 Tax=Streptomyces sp. NPDC058746 TaxID=3346622 RepID=UPI00367CEFC5